MEELIRFGFSFLAVTFLCAISSLAQQTPPVAQQGGRGPTRRKAVVAAGVVGAEDNAADDNRFRAFDAKTGKELWSAKLNASAESVPATYLGKDGGQYVVVAGTGGGDAAAPVTSDEITAFRLPKPQK